MRSSHTEAGDDDQSEARIRSHDQSEARDDDLRLPEARRRPRVEDSEARLASRSPVRSTSMIT